MLILILFQDEFLNDFNYDIHAMKNAHVNCHWSLAALRRKEPDTYDRTQCTPTTSP